MLYKLKPTASESIQLREMLHALPDVAAIGCIELMTKIKWAYD